MSCDSKTFLVTGATSGIGKALTHRLLANGHRVIAFGRNRHRLDELAAFGGDRLQPVDFDLTSFSAYKALLETIPIVDGVVYSAGIVENNPIRFFSLEKYRRVVDLNQTAPLALVAELAQQNKIAEKGSLVFLSSINGTRVAIKGCAAYAASKAALTGIAKVLALELAHKLIRVNCVLPGMVDTQLVANLSQLSAKAIEADRARYPLGSRYAKPDEIVDMIVFLLSDTATFITGENFVVDGGYCAQ